MTGRQQVILASKSPSRTLLLKNAGVCFEVASPQVDEAAIKQTAENEGKTPEQIGRILAFEKAKAVSRKNPGRYVVGADQILEMGGQIFDKPANMAGAAETLRRLRGKSHTLISCLAVVHNEKAVFQAQDRAHLTMRDFSDQFMEAYLRRVGAKALTSVGAYQLEGEGATLFEEVEGDFFTILGLPLLPLLKFFRDNGVMEK